MVTRLCASLVLALGSLLPLRAHGAELSVGQGRSYATLGAALAAAQPGDTLRVASSVYHEALVINTPVRLIGENWPQIAGTGVADTLLINADDVEITGFVISGSGSDMMHSDAGVKVHGSRAKVQYNRLRDNQFGVYLGHCEQALIEGNTITGRKAQDLGSRGAGVHFYLSNHNTVRDNEVSYVRDGVYFDHSDNNLVEDNSFHDLRYGVHYMYCGPNEFYRNIFTRNVAGAAIMYTDKVIFSDNQIISNRNGYNAFGLLFQACSHCVAERNVIVNNTSGLFLEGSRENRISHNLIAYNDVGVFLYGSSPDNDFTGNDFVGNLSTLIMAGKTTVNWAPNGLGNYYSDYTGYDLNHDRVGDIPHKLQDAFENLAGNHPLLRLYLDSAAADALAFAEHSFPLLPSSEQYDKFPVMSPVSGMHAGLAQAPPQATAVFIAVLTSLVAVTGTAVLFVRLAR